jgi:hypothetical protein
MGDWYWIGLVVGIGVGCGLAFSGALAAFRAGLVAAALLGAAAGVGIGFALDNWDEALGGGLGGLAGVLGSAQVVRGTLRRGGTRWGTAALVALAAVAVAALALVPGVGYLEAVALPALGARLRRRAGQRYAGLRVLARD